MTASELKCNVERGQDGFFFTRETMRFFGDTMRNYGVRNGGTMVLYWDNKGNTEETHTIEVWELYRKHPVKHGLKDSAYFDKKTFRRVFNS